MLIDILSKDAWDQANVIYGFSKSLLSAGFDEAKKSPECHLEMWAACASKNKNVALAAPRRHAKSTAITHVYALYSILFGHSDHVLIISDTEGQAVQFLGDIKMELMENDNLIALFDVGAFLKESEKEIILYIGKGSDRRRVRVLARGAETSLRGLKWRHKRPNLVIADDMENDESVMNEERREKRKKWFLAALMQAVSKNAKFRIVGTILHFDSLLESLMPPITGDGSEFTEKEGSLKIYSTDTRRAWFSIKYRAHTDFDDFSELLWEEMFSKEDLIEIRDEFVRQGYPDGYSQEYLNYPIVESYAFFRRDDMPPMTERDYMLNEERRLSYYAAIDPAVSTKDRRSYTAIVVAGMAHDGALLIVDVIRERIDSKELVQWMFDVQKKYQPDMFIVEDGVIRKSFGPFLKEEMLKDEQPFINIHAEVPLKDKVSRARAIQGRMRQGAVRFDHKATWWPSFMEELMRFDRGEYDDQVDALSWIGLVLNKTLPGKTKQEKMDELYEEDLIKDPTSLFVGQDPWTGY